MAKSTKKLPCGKLDKPRPDFPLFPHSSGRWAKKVRGKRCYFGSVKGDEDGQKALAKWLAEKDYLLAGRTPPVNKEGLTVGDLCNHFWNHKKALVASGELAPRSFERYDRNGQLLVDTFGKDRLVDDLTAQDFEQLRGIMSKRWAPVAVANEIQLARSVFRYGYEAGLIDKPIRFGPGFKKPSAKVLRQVRQASGPKMFTAAEIQAVLNHSTVNMRAALLLAINGALGNTDLALLPISVVDLAGGWLDYPRAKTAIQRRIPLWPETVEAIKAVLEARREPNNQDDAGLLFVGRRGESYRGNNRGYRIHQEARRVFAAAGVKNRSFYDLRRTFQTIAEGAHDLVAVQAIMGHAPASGDMSAVYRQRVDDERLQAVAEHVRNWVFAIAAGDSEKAGDNNQDVDQAPADDER